MIFPRLTGKNRTAAQLTAVVVTMGSLSFAAVPFYDWFCRVTGYGGTPAVAETAPDVILDPTVKVRFHASVERGMTWVFQAGERAQPPRTGDAGLAY